MRWWFRVVGRSDGAVWSVMSLGMAVEGRGGVGGGGVLAGDAGAPAGVDDRFGLGDLRRGERGVAAPGVMRISKALKADVEALGHQRGHRTLAITRKGGKRALVPLAPTTSDALEATSPHSLRHAFVTAALDAGASLRDVQDAAGHADPRTTRRYDRSRHARPPPDLRGRQQPGVTGQHRDRARFGVSACRDSEPKSDRPGIRDWTR